MRRIQLEPGLLQVFRLYAWLQAVYLVALAVPHLTGRQPLAALWLPAAFQSAQILALLALLYSPWLQQRLGRLFIPLSLVIAVGGLLISQHLAQNRGLFWQGSPFLTILVILVAWQYEYLGVIIYTLAVGVTQLFLFWLLPLPILPRFVPLEAELTFNFVFWIANSVTFLVVGYVVNRLSKAQRQQRQALAQANQKLVSHAATLEQLATSRERVRLARELHDTLAHTLSAQAVQLEAVMTVSDALPPKARAILEQMQAATRTGLTETRRALSALRAAPLEELGLAAAVQAEAEDFSARHNLTLDEKFSDNLDDLPEEVENCIYRVAQEALENVARHADAQHLAVHLLRLNGHVTLKVADDGHGFDPQQGAGEDRFGLRGMRERAELVGAGLEIISQPGQGTTLQLTWERPQ